MMVPSKVKSCKGVEVVVGSSFPGRCMVPVVAVAQRSVFKEERKIKSIRKDIVATMDVPELLCQALVDA